MNIGAMVSLFSIQQVYLWGAKMKATMMILVVSMALFSCTSARISSELASGAIGCRPDEITIVNETASFSGGRHNFEAICKGKHFICSYHSSTGMNCKETIGGKTTEEDEKNYLAYRSGIVKDITTGLEWKAGPDYDINWNNAKSWVESLKLDGGRWRMPTVDEVKTLYKEGSWYFNITPLLKTTGWGVWAKETKGSEAMYFYFVKGDSGGFWCSRNSSVHMRAFAVRSRTGSTSKRVEVASVPKKPSHSQPSSISPTTSEDQLILTDWSYSYGQNGKGPYYEIRYSLSNKYDKGIKLIDGSINFKDLLGDRLYDIKITPDLIISSGGTVENSGSYKINQVLNEELRMKNLSKEDVVVTISIRRLVFTDNTILEK
jgi:hypothetical protein